MRAVSVAGRDTPVSQCGDARQECLAHPIPRAVAHASGLDGLFGTRIPDCSFSVAPRSLWKWGSNDVDGEQIQRYGQAEATGRAHRGGLRGSWRSRGRSRAPCLGDRQQGVRRRQQVAGAAEESRTPTSSSERRRQEGRSGVRRRELRRNARPRRRRRPPPASGKPAGQADPHRSSPASFSARSAIPPVRCWCGHVEPVALHRMGVRHAHFTRVAGGGAVLAAAGRWPLGPPPGSRRRRNSRCCRARRTDRRANRRPPSSARRRSVDLHNDAELTAKDVAKTEASGSSAAGNPS